MIHASLADRPVVCDETPGDMIRDGPDQSAHYFDAQAGRTPNERLGALARDDLRDLTALGHGQGELHVCLCNASEH